MMNLWLGDGPSRLPAYASSYIGVGGFVLNNKDEVLCITEKHDTANLWKIPGGLIDSGLLVISSQIAHV